ncbi:MAG: NfeD family protein [Candidatus Gastranaerophilales bacterium]|nr:NfeD family protein [Candidatus Gastranaerophilales bacterium]
MLHWHILLIAGIVFLIIEIFTPVLFFLNFALACFLTAILALFIIDWNILIPVFVAFSAIFLIFLRPLLVKARTNGQKTGVEEKYIGKTAKVVETVTSTSGVVSIYDERWNARSESGEEIPAGAEVKIVRNESLLLYVEEVNGK